MGASRRMFLHARWSSYTSATLVEEYTMQNVTQKLTLALVMMVWLVAPAGAELRC